ncbi:hypothetical protein H6G41_30495 [Tolypothrix sp. FACHB-123]|uniref:hypothetical protein n=1 Tax=Tolypothrix sp. FACHB-123 TaxID=2692868 RepID=UPI00168813B3|nr:hypothetical protein [Tolypothrix sp. FACHB-123]MBD2358878.1 hypothetical protein [Tolypothrix sp. FACHB-123]
MTQKNGFSNSNPEPESFDPEILASLNTHGSTVNPLVPFEEAESTLEVLAKMVLDDPLETVAENPVKRWIEIAAPILKYGGKPVAVILALGFISIPLMLSGSPWVPLVLAIGAAITAIWGIASSQ